MTSLNCTSRRLRPLALAALLLSGCGDDEGGSAMTQDASAASTSDAGDAGAPSELQNPLNARLADGELQGDVIGGAVRFLKIPYAKPPVGPLRWRAPEPNVPWTGVRHESAFASPCPQAPSQQSPASMDEDCLYLNVWRPNQPTRDAPVMVWIHGGGFTTGSAADKVPTSTDHLWYDGRFFAERHGIVVVTINYRLGALGFFAHPELAAEGSPVGNQGLLDQQLALKWVQKNAAAFGGDPGKVTIFGESAGSASVCMHLVSPGSRGLFHRAISQSGGCALPSTTDRATIDAQLQEFASMRGCTGPGALACLRAKPVSELVSTAMVERTMGLDMLRRAFSFGPLVDGPGGFLPEPAATLFARGEVAKVPYLLGTNTEEARLYFLSAPVPADEQAYVANIRETYGTYAERVLELYPLSRFAGNTRHALARIASDSGLVCGTHETARQAAKAQLPVFMYNFNIPWSIAREPLGPSHASEISHVFGSPYEETPENVAVADVMNAYWAMFAASGDPNFPGAPKPWPAFAPDANDDDLRLQLDPGYEVLASFRKDECSFWREYNQAQGT